MSRSLKCVSLRSTCVKREPFRFLFVNSSAAMASGCHPTTTAAVSGPDPPRLRTQGVTRTPRTHPWLPSHPQRGALPPAPRQVRAARRRRPGLGHRRLHRRSTRVIDTLVYMRDVEGFTPTLPRRARRPPHDARPIRSSGRSSTCGRPRRRSTPAPSTASCRPTAPPPARRSRPQSVARPPEPSRLRAGRRSRRRPGGTLVAAAHMTWGAANELLTMNGYRLLADQCDDPMLAELLRRIAAQESRHYSFYLLQAEWRLAASRLGPRRDPPASARPWTPGRHRRRLQDRGGVPPGARGASPPRPESERIVDRMDRRFAALPGLERLRIYRQARGRGGLGGLRTSQSRWLTVSPRPRWSRRARSGDPSSTAGPALARGPCRTSSARSPSTLTA